MSSNNQSKRAQVMYVCFCKDFSGLRLLGEANVVPCGRSWLIHCSGMFSAQWGSSNSLASHRFNIIARAVADTVARDLDSDSSVPGWRSTKLARIKIASLLGRKPGKRDGAFNSDRPSSESARLKVDLKSGLSRVSGCGCIICRTCMYFRSYLSQGLKYSAIPTKVVP